MSFRFQSTYIVKTNDDLGSATYWNTRFQDIDVRINSCEIYASTITAAIGEITTLGLAEINSQVGAYVTALNNQISTLSASVTALQNLVVTDQNNIVGQLNTLLATAQTLVANLESLGVIQDGTF